MGVKLLRINLNFRFYFYPLFFAICLYPFRGFAFTNIPKNSAIVRVLNKQTGKVQDLNIPVGKAKIFENIIIRVRACYGRPDNEIEENSLFAEIMEFKGVSSSRVNSVKVGKTIFSGWMFSSSISLNPVEHPVYDVWVLKCEDENFLSKI